MSTQVLQITELTPKDGAIHQVSRAWAALPVPKGIVQRRVYEALDGSAVLELAALEKMDDLAALQPSWSAAWDMLGPDMASDFRRQINRFDLCAEVGKAVDGCNDGVVLLLQLLEISHSVFSCGLCSRDSITLRGESTWAFRFVVHSL